MRLKGFVLLAAVAMATNAYAQNTPKTATGTNTVSATLAVKATLAKAVSLTLNTGSGCTVSDGGGGDFSLDFGTVDALGVSTGCAGAGAGKFTNANQAIYYSDYTITPAFTNQATTTGSTLSAYVSSAFAQSGFSIVQSNSAHAAFADFSADVDLLGRADGRQGRQLDRDGDCPDPLRRRQGGRREHEHPDRRQQHRGRDLHPHHPVTVPRTIRRCLRTPVGRGGPSTGPPPAGAARMRTAVLALLVIALHAEVAFAAAITLSSSASGVVLGGSSAAATMNLGTGNGLGVGAAATGVQRVTLASGPTYSSPFTVSLNGWGGSAAVTVTAYVSTNFAHGSGATPLMRATYCIAADCTVAANHLFLSTSSAAPTTIRTALGNNDSFSTSNGALIVYVNGSTAFTGAETATITFTAIDANNTTHNDTATLTISSTVQTAVQFSLDTGSGPAVTGGSTTDYLIDFGTVDGLGVSSGNGATRSASAGGALYSTSYLVKPAFSSMTSTTGTVRMYVSANFAHPALLQLQDSSTGASNNFSAISTNSAAASQTLISSTAVSKASLTRYLGLFVFAVNGASAFVGADNAVITYTVIVP